MIRRHSGSSTLSVILGVLVLALAIGAGFMGNDWLQKKEKIEKLEKMREIASLDGILQEAMTFEFARIKSTLVLEHNETYDRPSGGAGALDDKVHIVYQANYTFTFGYDLKEWDWCARVIDKANGVVAVRAPEVVWTNANTSFVPDKWITIEGIYYTDLENEVEAVVKALMADKIRERAEDYLKDDKMQTSIRRSLSNFLLQTMNDAHQDANPISKVVLTADGKCPQSSTGVESGESSL